MVNGRTKKKGIIRAIIIIVALLAIAGFAVWHYFQSKIPKIEDKVFRHLAGAAEEENQIVKEMLIYYDDESDMVYCHVKYDYYFEHDAEWWNVEAVWYGTEEDISGRFRLPDPGIEDRHAEARSAFERVRKTAKCRVLSQEEIKEGLRVAYDQIAKENAEFDAEQEDSKK